MYKKAKRSSDGVGRLSGVGVELSSVSCASCNIFNVWTKDLRHMALSCLTHEISGVWRLVSRLPGSDFRIESQGLDSNSMLEK